MLKFLLSAALVGSASAAAFTGGIDVYDWPGDVGGGDALDATVAGVGGATLAVADPIGVDGSGNRNDQITLDVSSGTVGTYVGLFADDPGTTPPTSHDELVTGGPIVKATAAACISGGADCVLNLYRGLDVFDPVPAGTYYVLSMNGNDLNYANAYGADMITVTIDPYISAWGSTLMQTDSSNDVERGDDVLVTWDGLATGDVISYAHTSATGSKQLCPVDYHVITAAEAALNRGTLAFKTSGASTANIVGFAVSGAHTIDVWNVGATIDYTALAFQGVGGTDPTTALCNHVSLSSTKAAVTRDFTVIESDTITINSATPGTPTANHQAGTKITLDYNLVSGPSTSGMYVGLFFADAGTGPSSHVVDVDETTGATTLPSDLSHPISVAFLPVGVSGTGSIELATDTLMTAGDYIVYLLNSNDPYFEPIAETSYGVHGGTLGPHTQPTTFTTEATDIVIIGAPSGEPSGQPSGEPTGQPSGVPTSPTGEPTGIPTSSPSFVEEPWGEYVWTEKRHRKAGMCENQCSGHGTCEVNGNCKCFTGLDGEDEWTGPDCSSRTCPFDFAWVGSSINSNNMHPWAECSNKGTCDRGSGECQCFTGYEGAACQRTVCPDNCNDQGTCWPEKHLASKAGRVYEAPWDAMKHVGCLCDAGYRGPACDQQECPSGADPLSGYGNEAGRDCSGRGICDYSNGICACFTGFFGTRCQHQTTVM